MRKCRAGWTRTSTPTGFPSRRPIRPSRPAGTQHPPNVDRPPLRRGQLSRRDHVARHLSGRRGLGRRWRRAGSTLEDHPATLVGTVRLGSERTMIHRNLGRAPGLAGGLGKGRTSRKHGNQGDENCFAHGCPMFAAFNPRVLHSLSSLAAFDRAALPTSADRCPPECLYQVEFKAFAAGTRSVGLRVQSVRTAPNTRDGRVRDVDPAVAAGQGCAAMILLIDNYDSFTFNLVPLPGRRLGRACEVWRNDKITVADALARSRRRSCCRPAPARRTRPASAST